MLYDLDKYRVQTVGDRYFVAPNAAVIGQVVLGEDTSVWFSAVLRADNDRIVIGDRCNIQDGSIFHVDAGAPVSHRRMCQRIARPSRRPQVTLGAAARFE